MPIPKICRIPAGFLDEGQAVGSVSYHGIKGLLKFRLIRHNTFGVHSPFTTCEKIASLALRIFVVFPLLTLCAVTDLTIWLIKTATIFMIVRDKGRHFTHLIAIVALPILGLGVCLAGKSPAVLSPVTTRRMLTQNIFAQNFNDPIVRQCLEEGFREGYENESDKYTPMRIFPYNPEADHHADQINITFIETLLQTNYIQANDGYRGYLTTHSHPVCDTADGKRMDVGNHPLLVEAARIHNLPLIDLIAAKADPNLIYTDYVRSVAFHGPHDPTEFRSSILTGMLKFKIQPDAFERILAIPGLDVDLSVDGTTPIAVAFLYGQEECVEQLAKKGATLYLKHLEQLKEVVDAFNPDESNKAANAGACTKEQYTKTLMSVIGGEFYENNVYFKAMLNNHLADGLRKLFFGPAGTSVNELIDLKKNLADFKVHINKTIQSLKECKRKRGEEIYNIFAINSRIDRKPKDPGNPKKPQRIPLFPKELAKNIAEFLV